ncbi:hypothetical protein V425_02275 [Lactococcus lactis RTB018]|nr:hypothetical protein V425_02275 [Lactococcus lactis RTB018]
MKNMIFLAINEGFLKSSSGTIGSTAHFSAK